MNTGFIIQQLRKYEGLSQKELADSLGVARSYLSEIENGRRNPGIEFLRHVARYFDIPISLLVAWEDADSFEGEIFKKLQGIFAELLASRIDIDG